MAEKETRHQAYLTVYFCGSENCPPRHAYGPAVRPHYLLHVILKGRGIYQYKGQTYALSAGDAFLIPPAEVTYYQAPGLFFPIPSSSGMKHRNLSRFSRTR